MRFNRVTGCTGMVLALSLFAGCQSGRCPFAAQPRATVSHVILCWLKESGNAAQRRHLIHTSKTFRNLPGVVSVTPGVPLPSTRSIVDSTYDVAIVMRFADEAALQAYESHPAHQQAVRDVLRPLAARILIYDAVDR